MIREFIAIEDAGWADYVWSNPLTGEDESKSSCIIIRIGYTVVGVDAYFL